MIYRQYAGTEIAMDDEEYFIDPGQWSNEAAFEMASESGLELTGNHMLVLHFLRKEYFHGKKLTLRDINHSGIITLKEFYAMFPGAPLRSAARLAGLPKPESCV
jgi:dissimilatory sulfite reductase related protein